MLPGAISELGFIQLKYIKNGPLSSQWKYAFLREWQTTAHFNIESKVWLISVRYPRWNIWVITFCFFFHNLFFSTMWYFLLLNVPIQDEYLGHDVCFVELVGLGKVKLLENIQTKVLLFSDLIAFENARNELALVNRCSELPWYLLFYF